MRLKAVPNLPITTALTAVENEIPNVSSLVKKLMKSLIM